jgi:ADP-ribosylglycohydrolase
MSTEYLPLYKLPEYHARMRACWMGKAVAGAVGAPYEGVSHPLDLEPDNIVFSTVAPNDDLELQMLWLVFAERHGLKLNSELLSEAWTDWIEYGMDEYGVAIRNLKRGIKPPYSGYADNWFVDGLGAAIRSEIWACLFPGNPGAAAKYAAYDAMIDHHRDGVWAEMFWAAAESAAFLGLPTRRSLEIALKYIPGESRVAEAVNFMFNMYDVIKVWPFHMLRSNIMSAYGSHNFTDCVMNLCFSIAALLWHNDFAERVVAAANFGMDTDCTAATVGALTAIEQGVDAIPESWREFAAGDIEVSDFLKRPEIPRTVEAMSVRVENLAEKFSSELAGHECPLPDYEPVSPDWSVPSSCHSRWLAMPVRSDENFQAVPERVYGAIENPASMLDSLIEFPGCCFKTSGQVSAHGTIFWLTFLTVDEDYDEAQLMVCANTGLTVWFGGKQVINYHSRQSVLPGFHRTDGGATVPVKLRKGVAVPLLIRLIWSHDPLEICVGVADMGNQHIVSAKFDIPGV